MSSGEPAFLDTSVLVRYLTEDIPAAAERAAAIIEGPETLILSELVLVECAHVLATVYKRPRKAIVDVLAAFIQRWNVQLLQLPKPAALEALALCRDSKRISVVDSFMWAQALHAGASCVYSFDQRFPALGLEVRG